MARPTYYPDWAVNDENLPATGKANKVRTREVIRNIGWDKGQIPTAEEFNWQLNSLGMWIRYLTDEVVPNLATTYLPLTGTKINFSGDTTGTALWNGNKEITVDVQVVDNSHNHTSANISDATPSGSPNTIVKRSSDGSTTIGRALFIPANDSSNADLFFQNSSGTKVGSVNYSQTQNLINFYFDNGSGSPLSFVTLHSEYVEIFRPRSASGQGGEPNALVRFDYLGTQISNVNNNISTVSSDLQNYKNYATNAFVSDIRLGSTYSKIIPGGGQSTADSGGVMIGWLTEGSNPGGDTIYFKPIQKYVGGNWYTVGQL